MKKTHLSHLICTAFLFGLEVTVVGHYCDAQADRSMYFTLPFLIMVLLALLKDWNLDMKNAKEIRLISTAIYLMQFGIIVLGNLALQKADFENGYIKYLIYFVVVFLPICICKFGKNSKIIRFIF